MSNSTKEYSEYIRETIREDNHKPFGEHLNCEVWLDLKGHKEGRSIKLTNVHIPLGESKSKE